MRLVLAVFAVVLLSGCASTTTQVEVAPAPSSTSADTARRPAGEPSARQVVQALEAADLGISEVRDNTPQNCGSLGCVQLITTRTVSVYEWPTVEAAKAFAAKWGDPSTRVGRFVLSWLGRREPDMPSAEVRKAQAAETRKFLAS